MKPDYEKLLKDKICKSTRYPKKHGEWFCCHVFDSDYLVFDTWNGQIYHYPYGATPSDTNNMYGVVYVFYDNSGQTFNCKRVHPSMYPFWYAHLI